jgi:hypothetical protein
VGEVPSLNLSHESSHYYVEEAVTLVFRYEELMMTEAKEVIQSHKTIYIPGSSAARVSPRSASLLGPNSFYNNLYAFPVKEGN